MERTRRRPQIAPQHVDTRGKKGCMRERDSRDPSGPHALGPPPPGARDEKKESVAVTAHEKMQTVTPMRTELNQRSCRKEKDRPHWQRPISTESKNWWTPTPPHTHTAPAGGRLQNKVKGPCQALQEESQTPCTPAGRGHATLSRKDAPRQEGNPLIIPYAPAQSDPHACNRLLAHPRILLTPPGRYRHHLCGPPPASGQVTTDENIQICGHEETTCCLALTGN